MTGRNVVIVGTGQAGFQVAASLRDEGFDGRVIMIGDEPGLPYQRPPLSKSFLTSDAAPESVQLRGQDFYAQENIEVWHGVHVRNVDRSARQIALDSGERLEYDHLVLATGARARTLSIPGADCNGVLCLRTLADATRLRSTLVGARQVVVIGAGVIGLELAAVSKALRVPVHVLEAAERPMSRMVSAATAQFLATAHRSWGTQFSFGVQVARIIAHNGAVAAVALGDGRHIAADVVVVAVGVQPNTQLAADAGLPVGNGIEVDEHLLTPDKVISAIGDCANFPSSVGGMLLRLESVQNAVDQGRSVAARLVGRPAPYAKTPWFWSDQGEFRLQIVGDTRGHDSTVLRGSSTPARFSVFCFRQNRLLGIESVNRPADHMSGRKLLGQHRSLTPEQAADEAFDLAAHAAVRT